MKINKVREGGKLVIAPIGRVDTNTSSELEAEVVTDGIDELVFDFANVDYISSAGLRVLLSARKRMADRPLTISNLCPAVREVFDITGFSDIFTFA